MKRINSLTDLRNQQKSLFDSIRLQKAIAERTDSKADIERVYYLQRKFIELERYVIGLSAAWMPIEEYSKASSIVLPNSQITFPGGNHFMRKFQQIVNQHKGTQVYPQQPPHPPGV